MKVPFESRRRLSQEFIQLLKISPALGVEIKIRLQIVDIHTKHIILQDRERSCSRLSVGCCMFAGISGASDAAFLVETQTIRL